MLKMRCSGSRVEQGDRPEAPVLPRRDGHLVELEPVVQSLSAARVENMAVRETMTVMAMIMIVIVMRGASPRPLAK